MGKTINLSEKGFEREVAIAKLSEDLDLHPRTQVNHGVVNTYREALRAGAEFPPIEIDQKLRIIDGFHRVAAYRAAGHTTIRAIYRKVRNDAEFYELAIAANSHHGNMLTSYDRQRAIARAEELGITKDRIANLLMVRLETIEHVEKGFGSTADSGAPMPLKFSVRHLKGKQLSARQQKAHETVGGMNQSFYINQVILLLEGNLLDHQSAATVARLYHLKQLLDKYNFKKFELVS